MIKGFVLSNNEKKLALAVGIVVALLALDLGFRSVQGLMSGIERKKAELQKEWAYSSGILARREIIEAGYEEARSSYPKLFEDPADDTRVMAELDAAAKSAGVRVDMIRPLTNQKSSRYELTLNSSWTGVMKFLQESEGPSALFKFPLFLIRRQDSTGELVVSAQAERQTLHP